MVATAAIDGSEPAGTADLRARLLDAVAAIGPILRATEDEAERIRRLPGPAVEALERAGLFRMSAPREVGGLEADARIEVEVFAEVARHSSAAGWNLFVGCVHTALLAACVSHEAAATIWRDDDWGVVAGQMAPMGTATAAPGGLRVSGRYSWGSGISHAGWVLAGAPLPDGPSAPGGFAVVVVPKTDVEVLDNWHVLGVAGSGSYDYELHDVFVPDGYWFEFPHAPPLRGGHRYAPPHGTQITSAHIGFALGVGRRAIDEITASAAARRRALSSVTVAQRDSFRHDLGLAATRLDAATAHAQTVLGRIDDVRRAGQVPDTRLQAELRAAGTFATEVARDAALMALRYEGGRAIRLDHPLQRLVREVLVAQSHVHVTETNYDKLGLALLDRADAAELETGKGF